MKIFLVPIIILLLICLSGCNQSLEIADFTSDGCSLFPDSSIILNEDWCDCCFEHDIAYWKGGTEEERLAADLALRDCIFERTGSEELAAIMFQGVRFGGSPYFYNWYRWGYGWNYDRKYKALTDEEKKQVQEKLDKYYSSGQMGPCK